MMIDIPNYIEDMGKCSLRLIAGKNTRCGLDVRRDRRHDSQPKLRNPKRVTVNLTATVNLTNQANCHLLTKTSSSLWAWECGKRLEQGLILCYVVVFRRKSYNQIHLKLPGSGTLLRSK